MTLNRVKLGRAVTFVKYPASNSLNLAELMVNEPMKSIY